MLPIALSPFAAEIIRKKQRRAKHDRNRNSFTKSVSSSGAEVPNERRCNKATNLIIHNKSDNLQRQTNNFKTILKGATL